MTYYCKRLQEKIRKQDKELDKLIRITHALIKENVLDIEQDDKEVKMMRAGEKLIPISNEIYNYLKTLITRHKQKMESIEFFQKNWKKEWWKQ